MKQYFGYVYIWFDTIRKKFLIGSHHGLLTDGYTTSTGGIHVRNIFKSRTHTMKFKVLEYNTEKDDVSYTQALEQKWLDKRPNIACNARYYNKTNKAGGGFDREIQIKRVNAGTHHFLGGKIQRESNYKRLKNGTHNFLDRKKAQKNAALRVKNKSHHFLKSDFNKKPFKLEINGTPIKEYCSKVDAVKDGYPAHLIDKLRKFKKYTIIRGNYLNTKIKYKKGDTFTYISI